MRRTRTATGEEMVMAGGNDSIRTPERPPMDTTSFVNSDPLLRNGGLRDGFQGGPSMKFSHRRGSDASSTMGVEPSKWHPDYYKEEKPKPEIERPRLDPRREKVRKMFSRRATAPTNELAVVNDEDGGINWMEGKKDPRKNLKPMLARSTSNAAPGTNGQPQRAPLLTTQRRAENRAIASKPSKDSLSQLNLRRYNSIGTESPSPRTAGGRSQIPAPASHSPSPSPSRPLSRSSTSSYRQYSPVEGRPTGRPLRSSPSSSSLRSKGTSDGRSVISRQSSVFSTGSSLINRPRRTSNTSTITTPDPIPEDNDDTAKLSASAPTLLRTESMPATVTDRKEDAASSLDVPEDAIAGDTPTIKPAPPSRPSLEDRFSEEGTDKQHKRGASLDSFLIKPEPRSPTFSEDMVYSGGDEKPSPLASRSTSKLALPPKSKLEDESADSADENLDALLANEESYTSLLNPKKENDDDTFTLLGGSEKYEPDASRVVRPKKDVIKADRKEHGKRQKEDNMLRQLKSLQMEVKKARQGIEILERRLNGEGSSSDDNESDWVNESEMETGEVARIKKAIAAGQSKVAKSPEVKREETVVTKVFRWIAIALVSWVVLELALFWYTEPPKYSAYPISKVPPPRLGWCVPWAAGKILHFFTVTCIESILDVISETFALPIAVASWIAAWFLGLFSWIKNTVATSVWGKESAHVMFSSTTTTERVVSH